MKMKKLFALDFDGVLCDSALETGRSAWRCAKTLWPDEFPESRPSDELMAAFRRRRPYLETGFQSVIILKMICEGLPEAEFAERLSAHTERLLTSLAIDRAEIIRRFGETRDRWIAEDSQSWYDSLTFFPGAIEALRTAMANNLVAILTTRQERFTRLLLQRQGIDIPADRLWGLDRKEKKEQTLLRFRQTFDGDIYFVEDRLPTLDRVLATDGLESVKLLYASWGYGTPSELERARSTPRVASIDLPEFLALLAAP